MKLIQAKPGSVLWLGRSGEDDARVIVFDLSHWQKQYGDGEPQLIVQRPGEGYRYPVVLTVEGSQAYWNVSESDTDIPGSTGTAELRYYTDEGNVKSEIWRTEILASKDSPIGTPPEPYQDWVDQVLTAGAAAVEAVNSVDEAVERELTAAKERGEFGGAGDMLKSIYDTQNRNTDVFQYIDDQLKNGAPSGTGTCLPLAGGTMTGPLTLAGDPTEDLHAVPKQYVDETVGDIETILNEINGDYTGDSSESGESSDNTGGTTYEIGHGLKVESNTLVVDSVNDFEGDNSLPATASLVQSVVGNIETLLAII